MLYATEYAEAEAGTRASGYCHWCDRYVIDGGDLAGAPEGVIDWMEDGDYGCEYHPLTGEDGTGPHEVDVPPTPELVRLAYVFADEAVGALRALEGLTTDAFSTGGDRLARGRLAWIGTRLGYTIDRDYSAEWAELGLPS